MHTNLVQALEKQIKFCKQYERYKCGVFIRTQEQCDIVMKCISNLLLDRRNTQLKNYVWKIIMNNSSAQSIAEVIKNSEKILVVPHVNPDGDCIGSAVTLKLFIQNEYGKDVQLFVH